MSLREFFFESFAGDLEYHRRRTALYLVLYRLRLVSNNVTTAMFSTVLLQS